MGIKMLQDLLIWDFMRFSIAEKKVRGLSLITGRKLVAIKAWDLLDRKSVV